GVLVRVVEVLRQRQAVVPPERALLHPLVVLVPVVAVPAAAIVVVLSRLGVAPPRAGVRVGDRMVLRSRVEAPRCCERDRHEHRRPCQRADSERHVAFPPRRPYLASRYPEKRCPSTASRSGPGSGSLSTVLR